MPTIAALRRDRLIGRIAIPNHTAFTWFLAVPLLGRTRLTVPVRVLTQDKGWTQLCCADLTSLSDSQIELLIANGVLLPDRANLHAAA
jgi:hypothetical protein